jgi:hypothetical protein
MRKYITRKGVPRGIDRKGFVLWQMPYGICYCADGREVLFNRDYVPICERYPGQSAKMADPTEWVPKVRQEWFYEDKMPRYKRPKIPRLNSKNGGCLSLMITPR